MFKCHDEVLSLQPMISPKRFDVFIPDWGMLRRSRGVQIFLYTMPDCLRLCLFLLIFFSRAFRTVAASLSFVSYCLVAWNGDQYECTV